MPGINQNDPLVMAEHMLALSGIYCLRIGAGRSRVNRFGISCRKQEQDAGCCYNPLQTPPGFQPGLLFEQWDDVAVWGSNASDFLK